MMNQVMPFRRRLASTPMPLQDPLMDAARLAAVRELALADGPQQEEFARLNRLAVELLDIPLSSLSIISEDRHVVAGQAGISDDQTARLEYPLSHSFCKHVARSGEPLIVEDSLVHKLVKDNPAAEEYSVRAYAGMPLRLATGEVVGAFCAIDKVPHTWTPREIAILEDLAGIAVGLLERRRAAVGTDMKDTVTGIARLPLFTHQLQELLDCSSLAGHRLDVVAVNLGDFRLFNHAWGHAAGDELLRDIAGRLSATVGTRGAHGHLCRVAADTFLVAAPAESEEPAGMLEDQVRRAITLRPAQVDGREHILQARVTSVSAPSGAPAGEITQAAIAAVEHAARSPWDGAGTPPVAPARRRLAMRNLLRDAVRRGEMSLEFQPVWNLGEWDIDGFEALLRWTSPDLGVVGPDEFIPVAESSGTIVGIGEWVLDNALETLAVWRHDHPQRNLTMSVNVAPEQLLVPSFVDRTRTLLAHHGVPAHALTLEVTERTLALDQPAMVRSMEALRAIGVRLSVDDFGTGFSSLGRLASFPLDELKIDRLFVAGMDMDERQHALASGIIAMAGALGLKTVAEGIETDEQAAILTAMGCTQGQGFLLAKPMSVPAIDALLSFEAEVGAEV